MSTKTPETDKAHRAWIDWMDSRSDAVIAPPIGWDFARSLELRNSELTARIAELEKDKVAIDACLNKRIEVIADRNTEIAGLKESLAEARKDSAWQPIETAPKDGTEIVCWLGGPACAGYDSESKLRVLRWSDHYSVFGLGGCWTDGLSTLGDRIDITLWMPLPATPLPETEGTI